MKRVALINDLSGFGKCSLTAAIPVLSVMGVQACPLPTAILSAQTGFDSYFYDDYTDRMNLIVDEWAKMGEDFDGIASGYMGSPAQIENVLYFLDKFHTGNTIFLADPIMGDNGKCAVCFSQELLCSMRELTERADVITPNLTELCLLAGESYEELYSHRNDGDYIQRIAEIAEKLSSRGKREQTVIVTGILRQNATGESIGNLVIQGQERDYVESPYTGKSFSGTGDLFSSVVMGGLMKGQSAAEAVGRAVTFLQPAIAEATENYIPRNHGVQFEKYLGSLIS